ncbi:unnamed protein product [Adineta steineri]|uniref:Uncharacterized protein n=3 Tax=Adineta steineri TaxID=433720 RepID=A0A813QUQ2_9BILA|nr:unnamed protein product [Adineta steineri]
MLTTTTITPIDAPITTTINNTLYPSHLHHALIIDRDSRGQANPDTDDSTFLNHLRTLATQPIDMVQFLGDTPSLAIWEALKDLKNVSHLEMLSGYDEYCNITPLDQVGSSWPLQSLVIGSAAGESINTAHLQTITSLKLDYCCGLSFDLCTRDSPSKLKQLTIIENDACDHFIKFQEKTSLLNHLIELKLQSTNGCDFSYEYDEKCFGKALIQCHSIKSLDLTMSDSSDDDSKENYLIELPVFFPPNVEVLRFRGPPTLANHLSVWQKRISDPKWLPNLKSIQFCLDVCHRDKEIPSDIAKLVHEQSTQFLKDLKSFRPSVTILDEEAVPVSTT